MDRMTPTTIPEALEAAALIAADYDGFGMEPRDECASEVCRGIADAIRALAAQVQPAPVAVEVKPREFSPPYMLTHADGDLWTLKSNGFIVASYSLKAWGTAEKIIEAAWQHAYGQPAPDVAGLIERAFKDGLRYANTTNVRNEEDIQQAWEWSKVRAELAKWEGK